MDVTMQLFSTRAYLDKAGMPDSFEDLANHRIISQSLSSQQVNQSAAWLSRYCPKTIVAFDPE